MPDTRRKDKSWKLEVNPDGTIPNLDAHLAVLMDIRDELKELNLRFRCPDFLAIPRKLDAIKSNTAKPMRKRKCPPTT